MDTLQTKPVTEVVATTGNDRLSRSLRHLKWFLIAVLLTPIGLGAYAIYIYKKGNFHVLTPGKAYRSAQLDKERLQEKIKKFGIKTILNLRESAPDASWYKDEKKVCLDLGVAHHDFNLLETVEVTNEQLERLTEFLKNAPKPILIHCAAGADRTGLTSALYRLTVEGMDAEASSKELSVWYGHVPYFNRGVDAMDKSFWRFATNRITTVNVPKPALGL